MMKSDYFFKRYECPVCSSSLHREIVRSPFTEPDIQGYLQRAYGESITQYYSLIEASDYSLLQCQECELIFQESIPSTSFMEELYNSGLGNLNASLPQNYALNYYALYSQDVLQVIAFLNKSPGDIKILDFGMGWGRWALMAKAFGCDVYGIELSQHRLDFAQTNGIKALNWEALDRAQVQFDFINTDQVFEHLAQPFDVLIQLSKVLKPNGTIKICVPNSFGIKYRLQQMDWSASKGSIKSLNPVAPWEHINCFHRKSMLKLAERARLQEVKAPLSIQYQYTNVWNNPKQSLRNILMPIYRNVLGLQNYYLFQKTTI
jgi:2-polyprenyl-3-methyl-5-hydroxy-6-metoxy-1,4-benzoquinol methylase